MLLKIILVAKIYKFIKKNLVQNGSISICGKKMRERRMIKEKMVYLCCINDN